MMRLDPSEEDSDDSGNGGRDSPMAEGQMVDLEVVITLPPPPQPHPFRCSDEKIHFTFFGLGSKPRGNTRGRLRFFSRHT